MDPCPHCHDVGRPVSPATLEAQVLPDRLHAIEGRDTWRVCGSSACDVVYFDGEDCVRVGETAALPFHKATGAERRVCFCFGHTLSALEEDLREHGRSTIRARITEACRAGEDDCVRRNPKGRCCLGDVAQVLGGAAPRCCGTGESA